MLAEASAGDHSYGRIETEVSISDGALCASLGD